MSYKQIFLGAIPIVVSTLGVVGCVDSQISGNKFQQILLESKSKTDKYVSNVSIEFDPSSNRYIMQGWGMLESTLDRPIEPRVIYNKFKCYFTLFGGEWVAVPAKEDGVISTLRKGKLKFSEDGKYVEVVDSELAPFYGNCPSINLSKKISLFRKICG